MVESKIAVYGAIGGLAVAAVGSIEYDIRLRYPKINRIYIEARSISSATRPPNQPRPQGRAESDQA